jgi:hypothetical protein
MPRPNAPRQPPGRAIRSIAPPLLLWSMLALGWALPVPEGLGHPGLWSALAAVGVFGWAQRHSRAIAWALAIGMALLLAATHWAHGNLGLERLVALAAIVLATAAIAHLAVRRVEGLPMSPRAVFDDIAVRLLALAGSVLRRIGVSS